MSNFAVDFRYFEVRYELWALGQMLDVVEPAIEAIAERDLQAALTEIECNGWQPGDGDGEAVLQEVVEKSEYVLPRFMRGPFLVALWACYETAIQAVARRRAAELAAPVSMNELRGDFRKRAIRYFDAILDLPLDQDAQRMQRLGDLYTIRCAIAHANGLREGMSSEKWNDLTKSLARQGLEPNERDTVVLTHDYVTQAYADVSTCLFDLLRRAND